jgi:hypothetical protein
MPPVYKRLGISESSELQGDGKLCYKLYSLLLVATRGVSSQPRFDGYFSIYIEYIVYWNSYVRLTLNT